MTFHRPPDRAPSAEQLVEELASRHRTVALLAAHDVLGDWTLAEDAAQLAFLLILKRLRAGDADLLDTNPEAAVRRNARWAAMKLRRRTLRRADAEQRYGEGNAALSTDHCSRSEARLACETVLRRLPDHYRDAIGLRFFRDLSDGDAAASLDVTLRAYRRRLDRAMAAARTSARAVGLRGAAALLVTLGAARAVLRRGREATGNVIGDLTSAWAAPVVNATALVVLGGGTAAVPALAAFAPAAALTPSAPAPVAMRVDSAAARAMQDAAMAGPAQSAPATASATPTPHGLTAAQETPEDSTIYSAAAAPGDDGTGRVVALGTGHSCNCLVVFESADAGHTWRAAPGPALNVYVTIPHVTLPPSYPADPRIFIDVPWNAPSPDLVAQRFGATFDPMPLSGYLTLPPSFERDGTVIVAEGATVVETTLQPPLAAPLVFQPAMAGTAIVTAARAGSDPVFVVGGEVAPSSGLPGAALDGQATRIALYRCTGTMCRAVSTPAIPSVQVVGVSTRFATDQTLALAWNHDVVLSRDAGVSFTALPDPGAVVTAIDVTSDARGPVVWATIVAPDGRTGVTRWAAASGWVTVIPLQSHTLWGGFVHPLLLGAEHVVVQTGESILCTADAGRTWDARCP